jgi:cell division protein FtsL
MYSSLVRIALAVAVVAGFLGFLEFQSNKIESLEREIEEQRRTIERQKINNESVQKIIKEISKDDEEINTSAGVTATITL